MTITPVDDDVPEPDDVVRVSGAVSNAAIPDPDDVTVEIINNDPEDYDFAVSAPPAVDEGAGAAVVTVTLTTRRNTAPTAYTDLYYLSKLGETATRGDDYTPPAGVDYGPAGVLFARVQPSAFSPNAAGTAWVAEPSFTIGIIDDQEAEVAETIVFEVDFPGDQTPAHTITLRDNDAPPGLEVTLQLSHDRILEFPSPVTVTATVSPASPVAFTVAISATPVAPATADDFTLSTNRVLRFAADATESTGTVTIRPVDDDIPEPHDVVRVSGAVSNAAIPDPDDVTVEIINNDPEDYDFAVSAPPAVDEGAGAAVVTVTGVQHHFQRGAAPPESRPSSRHGSGSGGLQTGWPALQWCAPPGARPKPLWP